jgi:NADH-quinone oxidoreductase subunit I
VLTISPRFRGHTKLLADAENADKNKCTACGICVKACPSGSIKNVEGEKKEGEKRKTATVYLLDYTTCSQCGICVEVCPFDALGFSRDFNSAGYKREDFHYDLVKELARGNH